jgi:hypothetical protein
LSIGQAKHAWMISLCNDLLGRGALGRPAEHQHWHPRIDGKMPC